MLDELKVIIEAIANLPNITLWVRGWGRLGYLPNGAELQDEIGQMMADALNQYFERNQT